MRTRTKNIFGRAVFFSAIAAASTGLMGCLVEIDPGGQSGPIAFQVSCSAYGTPTSNSSLSSAAPGSTINLANLAVTISSSDNGPYTITLPGQASASTSDDFYSATDINVLSAGPGLISSTVIVQDASSGLLTTCPITPVAINVSAEDGESLSALALNTTVPLSVTAPTMPNVNFTYSISCTTPQGNQACTPATMPTLSGTSNCGSSLVESPSIFSSDSTSATLVVNAYAAGTCNLLGTESFPVSFGIQGDPVPALSCTATAVKVGASLERDLHVRILGGTGPYTIDAGGDILSTGALANFSYPGTFLAASLLTVTDNSGSTASCRIVVTPSPTELLTCTATATALSPTEDTNLYINIQNASGAGPYTLKVGATLIASEAAANFSYLVPFWSRAARSSPLRITPIPPR